MGILSQVHRNVKSTVSASYNQPYMDYHQISGQKSGLNLEKLWVSTLLCFTTGSISSAPWIAFIFTKLSLMLTFKSSTSLISVVEMCHYMTLILHEPWSKCNQKIIELMLVNVNLDHSRIIDDHSKLRSMIFFKTGSKWSLKGFAGTRLPNISGISYLTYAAYVIPDEALHVCLFYER